MSKDLELLNKVLDVVFKQGKKLKAKKKKETKSFIGPKKKFLNNFVFSVPENQENKTCIDSDGNVGIIGIPFGKPLTKKELKGKKVVEAPCWGLDEVSGEQGIIGYIRYAK
jgi:hypothetical protein